MAECIFNMLLKASAARNRMLVCLVDQIIAAHAEKKASDTLALHAGISDVHTERLECLKAGAQRSALFRSVTLHDELNSLLGRGGVSPIRDAEAVALLEDDEIPF